MAVDRNHRIADDLLAWYDASARALPWRLPPKAPGLPDPYRVWLAEVMLQQTTVATAIPRYRRFLARFPDVAALADAPLADVLHEWAGLGYYARARNLHRTAGMVAAMGGFPATEAGLRALPGIGDYTAAAIAAIAFGQPAVPVDANLLRVGARLFAHAMPAARARAPVRAGLKALLPTARPGDFAQALMDLGATLCLPARPRCPACPIARHCAGNASGQPGQFPEIPARRQRPHRTGTLWWLQSGRSVALVRRPASGLLGGLLALPGSAWHEDGVPAPLPAGIALAPTGIRVRHGFTHFTLELEMLEAGLPRQVTALDDEALHWWPLDRLAEAGLPSLYRKAAKAMLASRQPECFEAA